MSGKLDIKIVSKDDFNHSFIITDGEEEVFSLGYFYTSRDALLIGLEELEHRVNNNSVKN